MTDSGEKHIHPDFSRRHFFAACFMNCMLLSSTIPLFRWASSLSLLLECASSNFSIKRCRLIFFSRLSAYFFTTCGRRVFSRLDAARRSRGGPDPTREAVWKSMTNSLWSPIPYPAGIIHALATVMSGVAQIPSIGSLPRKCVGPILFPVYLPTTSIIPSPSGSVRSFPRA